MTSPSDLLQTDYDALGRPVRLRRTLNGTVYTLNKSFDASGRLLSTTYPDGDVVGSIALLDGCARPRRTERGL